MFEVRLVCKKNGALHEWWKMREDENLEEADELITWSECNEEALFVFTVHLQECSVYRVRRICDVADEMGGRVERNNAAEVYEVAGGCVRVGIDVVSDVRVRDIAVAEAEEVETGEVVEGVECSWERSRAAR